MIVTIVFDWQGRRLGYVRSKPLMKPRPDYRTYTHDLKEAMAHDSVEEAIARLPKLAQGEKPVYAERMSFKDAERLRKAA